MRPAYLSALIWVIAVLAVPSCFPTPRPTPGSGDTALSIRVVAGPVCPVERDPPDPSCEARPVAGAQVLVQTADGRDVIVAQGTTGADGNVIVEVPPGEYLVAGGEVEGLMGLPEPARVSVVVGNTEIVLLSYDTGIR
jgi:hypothetical protein